VKQKQGNYLALVLKSRRSRERDLLVTLLTKRQGKILVVAKGVGHLHSTKRASLEAGNLIRAHLIETKGLPILTQCTLIGDSREVRGELVYLRKFLLFLEILDRLLVSEELSMELWQKVLYLRELFLKKLSNKVVRPNFLVVLEQLGYGGGSESSIVGQVNQLLDSQLCSLNYLSLK
jgi:DNA repair protein RecO